MPNNRDRRSRLGGEALGSACRSLSLQINNGTELHLGCSVPGVADWYLRRKDRELVLGRRTYEIFEAYWPYQPNDNPIAKTLNSAKKHVASRTLTMLHWNNSTLLHGDAASAVIALKAQPGPDLQVIGSGNLIQTLQAASLIDEYNVWTFPVVLGRGKRLFSDAAKPSALRLVRSQVSTTGVVMSIYVPSGDIQPGSFTSAEPSEKELARRKKMADEMW
ncbi:MAG: dihydrofolate reductase family protein [Gammaproteobacteria bacterium]